MFSPYVFAQSAVLSFVPRTENILKKLKKTAYHPSHTNPWKKCGFSTGLARVWYGFFEKPELFQTKIIKFMVQDCAKDLDTSKSGTKVQRDTDEPF